MSRTAMIVATGTAGAAEDVCVKVSCTQADCAQMEARNEFLSDCNLKDGMCICHDDLDNSIFHASCTDTGCSHS